MMFFAGGKISRRTGSINAIAIVLAWSISGAVQANAGPTADLFFSGTVFVPQVEGMPSTPRGIVIPVGEQHEATVLFDTELLRMGAAWTGPFLEVNSSPYGMGWGTYRAAGNVMVFSFPRLGWSLDGKFDDPRPLSPGELPPTGPINRDRGRYRGLYVHEQRVVLAYTVGKSAILEFPWAEKNDDVLAITRTIELDGGHPELTLFVCEKPKDSAVVTQSFNGVTLATFENGSQITAVGTVGDGIIKEDNQNGLGVVVAIPENDTTTRLKVLVWTGKRELIGKFAALVQSSQDPIDLKSLTHGGPAQWGSPEVASGVLGNTGDPYAVDTLPLPERQSWNGPLHPSSFDFFANGDAVVSFLDGDVWILRGISDRLESVTWQRYATGLCQAAGVKVVDGAIYVSARDRITRLTDLNEDGEADFYENFNQDWSLTDNEHEFLVGLEADRDGNFWVVNGGPLLEELLSGESPRCKIPHQGCLLKISSDGRKLEVAATGFRSVIGLCIGPQGQMSCADQEGNWMPATRINDLQPGGFYGYASFPYQPEAPSSYDPPICWIPQDVDPSGAGQVWVSDHRWGPLAGQMLHLSYGKCRIFLVPREKVGGQVQGGVVALRPIFNSGLMQGRFRPQDGQLYVCGMRGWHTSAAKEGTLARVRYTGAKVHLPCGLQVFQDGIRVAFTEPLDGDWANDPDNYAIEQWNYRWSEAYGSKHYKVSDPHVEGHDEVELLGARLSEDGKSVYLTLEEVQPVMQMKIIYNLQATDGTEVEGEIHNTINQVGASRIGEAEKPSSCCGARLLGNAKTP